MAALLDWTADAPEAPRGRHLRALRVLLLAHFATQCLAWWIRPLTRVVGPEPEVSGGLGLVFAALAALALTRRFARAAGIAGFALAAFVVVRLLPTTANHTFLAALALGFFALLDPDRDEEAGLLLRSLRWVTVIVFFWAGVQKALHGLYFRGEFLAWMVAQGSAHWAQVFGWMLPADELARLSELPRFVPGAGPYRPNAPLFVLAANAVWVAEIALSVGLLWRVTRVAAALGAALLVFTIQLAPNEWMFALLYVQFLLLFVPGEWNRRLLPAFVAAYVYLLLALAGVAPGRSFLVKANGHL
jgi:hypothetical protein